MQISEIIKTNVNNVSSKELNNVNNVITLNKKTYGHNIKHIQAKAHKLADALNDQSSFKFYCKAAWELSEAQIWSNLEQAQQGNNPARYFTWLCKRQMQ